MCPDSQQDAVLPRALKTVTANQIKRFAIASYVRTERDSKENRL